MGAELEGLRAVRDERGDEEAVLRAAGMDTTAWASLPRSHQILAVEEARRRRASASGMRGRAVVAGETIPVQDSYLLLEKFNFDISSAEVSITFEIAPEQPLPALPLRAALLPDATKSVDEVVLEKAKTHRRSLENVVKFTSTDCVICLGPNPDT